MNSFIKKTVGLLLALCLFLSLAQPSFVSAAGENITVYCNNLPVSLPVPPVIEEGRTLVPVRPVLEAMNCAVRWKSEERSVIVQSGSIIVTLWIDCDVMRVEKNTGTEDVLLEVAPTIIDGSTYLPVRAVAEEFGAVIQWNGDTERIDITYTKGRTPTEAPTSKPTAAPTAKPTLKPTDAPKATAAPSKTPAPTEKPKGGRIQNGHTFYYQSEPAWEFPGNGSGYCWVCSYAMLLNDTVGNVTPSDVASINLAQGASGAYCYHLQIISAFGATFTSALSTDSEYFEKYDAGKGATYIKNPEHDEEIGLTALKEALIRNPAGVLVRFNEKYPHTIVAVGYSGDTVYFNDPMNKNGGANVEGKNGKIPFECTYPGIKGFTLGDISFIQAIKKK